ncbi:MAG: HlyD family efflux transporter periplasmic adaptor subunit [Pseudomonadota bacterium]
MGKQAPAGLVPRPRRAAAAVPPDGARETALLALLEIERIVRECRREDQLALVMTHETQKVLRCRQCFLLGLDARSRAVVTSATGLAHVDRGVPLIQSVEARVARIRRQQALAAIEVIDLTGEPHLEGDTLAVYPFLHWLWVPLADPAGADLGGLLLARESSWREFEVTIAARLAGAYGHALAALRNAPRRLKGRIHSAHRLIVLAALALAALAIPVPMSALAPLEVVARDAFVVTSGADGVIESVEVEPSAEVEAGALLARLVDLTARNRLELAEREVLVAQAKLRKWQQLSFSDARGNHELAIAKAELDTRLAERDWAREQMQRTEIRTPRAGVAVFLDKKSLTGKPVAIGERIMEVADPSRVEVRIDLPVADALVLGKGNSVRMFLDSAPLDTLPGSIVRADYKAQPSPANQLVFRATAAIEGAGGPPPRIGVRGIAQVMGDTVPLGYYLFRRPIAALRQWTGI